MKNFIKAAAMTLLLVFMVTGLQSCYFNGLNKVNGNGNVITQHRTVPSFSGLEVDGKFEIVLKQGAKEDLFIETDDNLFDYIETEVKGNTLYISTSEPIGKCKELKIIITFTELTKMDFSGASDVWSEDELHFGELEMECSGASDVDFALKAEKLNFDFSGDSEVDLKGIVKTVKLDCSGASEFNAEGLEVTDYFIDCSGASSCNIFVNGELNVELSGASSLRYAGNPSSINQEISGASSIKKL